MTVVAPRSYRGRMPVRYMRLLWDALTVRGSFVGVEAHPLFPTGLVGLVAAAVRRIPLVVVAHGSDVRVTAFENPVYRVLAGFVIRRAKAVVANSEDTAQHVAALGGFADIVSPGIDRALFRPSPRPARRRVLYLGGDKVDKGVDIARGLADTLAGPGIRPLSPAEVALEIAAHDVVLMPSHAEGYGLVAAEAGCAGRWVVARRVGGLATVVQDGLTGTLVRDDEEFADALAGVPDYDPFVVSARSAVPTIEDAREAMTAIWARVLATSRRRSPTTGG